MENFQMKLKIKSPPHGSPGRWLGGSARHLAPPASRVPSWELADRATGGQTLLPCSAREALAMLRWQLEKWLCSRAQWMSNPKEPVNDATVTDPGWGAGRGWPRVVLLHGCTPRQALCPDPRPPGCPEEGVCSRPRAGGARVHHQRGQGGDRIPARACESDRSAREGNAEGNASCQGPGGRGRAVHRPSDQRVLPWAPQLPGAGVWARGLSWWSPVKGNKDQDPRGPL